MSTQETRRRAPQVVREGEDRPLGDVGPRVRNGVASWLRSPALDFYGLIVVGALLVGIGLVMVLSSSSVSNISQGESGFTGLFRQGRFALIGLVGLVIAAFLPPGFYRKLAWPLLGLGIALQLLVFSPLGIEEAGNRNWILVGGQTLQPSELLKLSLAVWLGAMLATKRPLLHRPFHLLFPLVPIVVVALGLVVLGHDLGTMIVMAFLVAGAMWVSGIPRRWFAAGAVVGVIGVAVMTLTSDNRMRRIDNWIHGTCEGEQCLQSDRGLQALAEGGWWGVGLGESRQKWGRLPAAEDDFIFAVLGEELGLVGTLGVLLLFGLLALLMFRMITRSDDHFVQITVGAVSAWILGQALVNMMVVTGLLPVLGVPLPFISSGGSALIASMLALGMLISFARHEPGAADAVRSRIGTVRRSFAVVPAAQDSAEETGHAVGNGRTRTTRRTPAKRRSRGTGRTRSARKAHR